VTLPRALRGSAVYAFVDDFVDSGTELVADRIADNSFGGVALAAVYHAARDVVPHNRMHAVVHRDEGAHYFEPAPAYPGLLQPRASDRMASHFDEVTTALAARELWWQAWTVYLHNGRLAAAHPECAVTNAFGDAYLTDLCPTNADVAAYAIDLTADVARLQPALIVAESLHFAGFSHGYHHERAFVDVTPLTAFLLSVCFCAACIGNAAGDGIDGEALAARVRDVVRASLTGTPTSGGDLDRARIVESCGEALLDYLRARERVVTALTAACADTARNAGVAFGFMDQTGALKGYLTGQPSGALAVDDGWQLGIDAGAAAESVDSYIALTYARDAERVRADATAYARVTAGRAELRCVLRHSQPDVSDSDRDDDLRVKVTAVDDAGAVADFYHYGLMPLAGLTAAGAALASLRAGRNP
jgi:hypothetical protein